MDAYIYVELFAVAVIAGCFDAIAGGGGLITVPMLLLSGLDPVTALGTNKLQGSFGSFSATMAFARKGLIHWKTAIPVAMIAFLAAILGALSTHLVRKELLSAIIPLLLIAIAIYFALNRRVNDQDARARLSSLWFCAFISPLIGFYDGIFGPGTGTFFMIGFVSLLGFGVLKATGHTKLANMASNLGALFLFSLVGSVSWSIGLMMAVGAILGAQLGSKLAFRLGTVIIRPLLVVISCTVAVKLLLNPDNLLSLYIKSLFARW